MEAGKGSGKKMITDGEYFTENGSLDQKLTFHTLENRMNELGLNLGQSQYIKLGLIDSETNDYTNLARIVSDQNPWTVKIGVFRDQGNTLVLDSIECKGSALSILDQSLEYIDLYSKSPDQKDLKTGMKQIDYFAWAIREAVLNAIIHRDYSCNTSILIAINESGVTITSPGGIPANFTAADISQGISLCRNQKLADLFYQLKYSEAYGIGICRIFQFYQDAVQKPEITATEHTFRIRLPFMSSGIS